MILTAININVVCAQRERQFGQLIPALEAQFTLQCLMCGHIHQLTSPTTYPVKAGERLHAYTHPIATVVKQHRACDNCGMLSTLPKLDSERLKKTLEKHITREFIDLHSQDQAPFLAQRLLERSKLI